MHEQLQLKSLIQPWLIERKLMANQETSRHSWLKIYTYLSGFDLSRASSLAEWSPGVFLQTTLRGSLTS